MSNLKDSTVLVKLSLGRFTPYAFDAGATHSVELAAGVARIGRFNKHLMKDSTRVKETNAKFSEVYAHLMKNTLPWTDTGMRMLPSDKYFQFSQEIRQLMIEAEHAADMLAQDWPVEVAHDMARLGALAKHEDYPTNVRKCYYARVQFYPVPDVADFRVEVSDDDKAELEAALQATEDKIPKYLAELVKVPLEALSKKCDAYTGTKGERWHESMVGNVWEMARRMRDLNVSKDYRIDKLSDDVMDVLAPYMQDKEILKTDAIERDTLRRCADDLIKQAEGI